jgi:hypothetical protein
MLGRTVHGKGSEKMGRETRSKGIKTSQNNLSQGQ